jgi:hypothetical protein
VIDGRENVSEEFCTQTRGPFSSRSTRSRQAQISGWCTEPRGEIPAAGTNGLRVKNLIQTGNNTKNKSGTEHPGIGSNMVQQHQAKSLRGKDGLFLYPAHNPKVASSNLAPATMGAKRLNLKAPFFLGLRSTFDSSLL